MNHIYIAPSAPLPPNPNADVQLPFESNFATNMSVSPLNPVAPIHVLIIPKKLITKLSDSLEEDRDVLGHLMLVAKKVAKDLNLDDTFRIVINNGAKAGQSVFHLHLHLLSGRSLSWPPG